MGRELAGERPVRHAKRRQIRLRLRPRRRLSLERTRRRRRGGRRRRLGLAPAPLQPDSVEVGVRELVLQPARHMRGRCVTLDSARKVLHLATARLARGGLAECLEGEGVAGARGGKRGRGCGEATGTSALEGCLGRISEVSRKCLGSVSETSRKCLGSVSEVSSSLRSSEWTAASLAHAPQLEAACFTAAGVKRRCSRPRPPPPTRGRHPLALRSLGRQRRLQLLQPLLRQRDERLLHSRRCEGTPFTAAAASPPPARRAPT